MPRTKLAGTGMAKLGKMPCAKAPVTRRLSRNPAAFANVEEFELAYKAEDRRIRALAEQFGHSAADLKARQESLIRHLTYMQALLSKRGPYHYLVIEARRRGVEIPWWTDYFKRFQGVLWESLRTIERRISACRRDPSLPPREPPERIPHLNRTARKTLIEAAHNFTELVLAKDAGYPIDQFIEAGKKIIDPKKLDDILETARTQDEQEANWASAFVENVNTCINPLIRDLQSPSRRQTLNIVLEHRNRLNPTLRGKLIRALEHTERELAEYRQRLSVGYQEYSPDGKAFQRKVREQMAKLPDPELEDKRKAAADLKHAVVREISYETARDFIVNYEWLGNLGSTQFSFGLYAGKFLAGVVCFGTTGGTMAAASICGPEHAHRVIFITRGACAPWAHPHSASFLISHACEQVAKKGFPIIVGYADPAAGEIGVVYQASNFIYCGMSTPTQKFRTPDGTVHDSRDVHNLTRDRTNGVLRYKRSRAEQMLLLVQQGCQFFKGNAKHRYVRILGDRRTRRMLLKALRWPNLPYPRREQSRDIAGEQAA